MLNQPTTQRTTSDSPASTGFLNEFMVLFKVRIVLLLVFAALGGAFLAAQGWPGGGPFALLVITGSLAAMGSSALNEYIEREKDALMLRTKRRPLVTGAISQPRWVLAVGLVMIAAPVLAVLPFNPALSLFLALGAFTYVVIYTIWLKPRTTLNIVIGGAAGSFAVMSGGAAVDNWTDPGLILLALLLFFWTPIHFWALALVYKEDYARAGVPMLPVQTTGRQAAFWGLLHGIAVGAAAMALATRPGLGPVYFVPVLLITVALVAEGVALVVQPTKKRAWHLFHTSNFFLAVVLLAICVAAVLNVPWPVL